MGLGSEAGSEPSSTPKLPEPSDKILTPPPQTSASVPSRWEDELGKPRPSPTTVLDGPVKVGKSVFSSASFMLPRERRPHRLHQRLLERKTGHLKGSSRGLYGWLPDALKLEGTSASVRADCVISPSSSSSMDSGEGDTMGEKKDTTVGDMGEKKEDMGEKKDTTVGDMGEKKEGMGEKEEDMRERQWKRMRRNGSFSTHPSIRSLFLNTLPHLQTTGVSLPMSNARKAPSDPFLRGLISRAQRNKALIGLDKKLVDMINSEIVDRSPSVKWEDVAGLEMAKQALLEMVILPTKRKDLFTGLRKPAKGLVLFGPPGTGKTMLAKAVASESEATFFSISASSLTSKRVGEGEKLVKTLFAVAVSRQPSVIFIDEIDSVLSARKSNEHEASRRLKSEFLVQFDGVTSNSDDLVIVIGATNKPQELDDAVLRRLVKRIYIPLPDVHVRRNLVKHKLKGQAFSLPDGDLEKLVRDTEGYSGSDLKAVCEEAAMMPIRELGSNILTIKADQVRRVRYGDFQKAMTVIRPVLLKSNWEELEQWNKEFGSN